MITLHRPEKTTEQLKALAASGVSRIAPQAKLEQRERLHAQMRAEIRAELAKRGGR